MRLHHVGILALALASACVTSTLCSGCSPGQHEIVRPSSPPRDFLAYAWTWSPDSTLLDSLWHYDISCSGMTPLRGHRLRDAVWYKANLIEASPAHDRVGNYQHDTIYVDTAVTNALDRGDLHWADVLAHELLHHLIQYRRPATPFPVTEANNSAHPFVPWEMPCGLMWHNHHQPGDRP